MGSAELSRSLLALHSVMLGSAAPLWADQPAGQRAAQACKRMMDVIAAAVLLVAFAPVLAVCALLVRLNSPGQAVFAHSRVGRGGREFLIWKFRTMYRNGAEILKDHLERCPEARREWELTQKLRDDPRVTPVGRILRRFSLDELPQLWNILRGEMSLVGPRPIIAAEIGRFGNYFVSYATLRPGLTGLWQVCGRSKTTYERRVQLDHEYVRQWSLGLDVRILLRTVRVVWSGDGAY